MKIVINNLEREREKDTVLVVHWSAKVKDGEYSASKYGSTRFTRNDTSPDFIPFDSLTEDIVIGWVTEEIDVDAIEVGLLNRISEHINPTMVTGIPWGVEEESEEEESD